MKSLYWPVDGQTKEVAQKAVEAAFRGGMHHFPKGALCVEPLEPKEGFAVIAKDDLSGSEYIEDHRGKMIYNCEDCNESKVVDYLGPIEDGWTEDKPPSPFHEWTPTGWQYSQEKERPQKTAIERHWRDRVLSPVLQRIEQFERDQNIAEQYRTSPLTAKQYEMALADRKALCDYPSAEGFPFGDRPVLSAVGQALASKVA